MSIRTSIITINYNGLQDTCELIETLPLEDTTLEVIVVDNGSTANEASTISQRYPQVHTIRSEQNLGFAGGNNLGIQQAHGEYLFLINNDTLFNTKDFAAEGENFAQALIDRLDSSPKIGMVCPKIRFAWGNHPIQYAGYTPLSKVTVRNHSIGFGEEDHGQYATAHPSPYAHGAAMMLKREVIKNAGLMPECYFLYYEELDWSMTIRKAGYEIWYEPLCTIYHKESQATGQNSPLKTYYITRNRLLLVKRHSHVIFKPISYGYLISLVMPKDILRHILNCRIDLAKATIRGVWDFLFVKLNN